MGAVHRCIVLRDAVLFLDFGRQPVIIQSPESCLTTARFAAYISSRRWIPRPERDILAGSG
jgi:hypothetical protein